MKHTIRGDINTGNDVRRREGSLFGFGKVVFGVTVQHHTTNGLERIVLNTK